MTRRIAVAVSRVGPILLALAACNGRVSFDVSGCDKDSECGLPSLHCDVVSAVCVACTSDDHCSILGTGRDRCDTAAHRCVECGLDSDCGQGRGCRDGHCLTLCQGEGFSGMCPTAAPYCEDDSQDGFCVQCGDDLPNACAASTAAGPLCGHEGTCVACQHNSDCAAPTPRCETFSGRCVECLRAQDCSGSTPVCDPIVNRCVLPG